MSTCRTCRSVQRFQQVLDLPASLADFSSLTAFNTVLQNQKISLAENFESLTDADAKALATALGLSPVHGRAVAASHSISQKSTTDANRRARELEDELLLQGCLAMFKTLPSAVLGSALEGELGLSSAAE